MRNCGLLPRPSAFVTPACRILAPANRSGEMRAGLADLYSALERAPEDWSVRIRLIEAAVSGGDLPEAKRLVRTSPDQDRHLPAELQDRIHSLLTRRDTESPIAALPKAGDGIA